MRHLLLSIALLLSLSASAQFHATPDGIKAENGKSYIVVEYPDKTEEQLYKAVEAYIVANFVSPKNVMSGQEYTSISLSPLYEAAFNHKSVMGLKCYIDVRATFVFKFKDGKLRLDSPYLSGLWGPEGEWGYDELLFKKSGKPQSSKRLSNFNDWLQVATSKILKQIDRYVRGSASGDSDDDFLVFYLFVLSIFRLCDHLRLSWPATSLFL